MSKDDYDNELKKCFYNENLLKYKKLNDLAIKASREEEGYAKKREDSWKRFEKDNAFWLKPSKDKIEEIVEVKEIVMKYDKKSDKFVKEELDEKIYDLVEDIVDYRNEMINQRKINKESALKIIKEIKEEPVKVVKVKDQKITNFQCECGCYLIRKDGFERHKKTKKHLLLMENIKQLEKPVPLGPTYIPVLILKKND